MNCPIRVFAALLVLAVLWPAKGLPQDHPDKSKQNEAPKAEEKRNDSAVSLKILISAEGKEAIPSGSKIQWEGSEENCKEVSGEQNLRPTGATPVRLPVCKVRLTIFITGFNTKAVTVDLAGNEKRYAEPIRIIVKLQGPAEVTWTPVVD